IGPVRSPFRALGYVVLLFAVAFDPVRAPLTHLADGESLRALAEGPAGIVTVVDARDDLQLRLDNYYVLGGSAAATTERRQGLVPLLLHPAPRRVAFIGMATGISASAATALGIGDVTVIEVVPEVAALARTHFREWNGALLEQPGVRLIVDDGRRYLAAARRPIRVDLELAGARLAGLPAWGRDSLLASPRALALLYVADLSVQPSVLPSGPINRDDHPVLEFLAPRLTRMSAAGDKDW